MKESDLYPPVKRWLEGQGLKVYPEVSVMRRPVDVVAIGEVVVGVEMKRSMTRKVFYQAVTLALACDKTYIAVGSKPRSIEAAKAQGIGVLRVVGDQVEVLLESAHKITPNEHYRNQVREQCAKLTGEGIGGVPNLNGVGPAQDCKRRVDEYRKEHRSAGWGEVWLKVPNHYANAKSMAGALTTGLRMRVYFKKLRRELKSEMSRSVK